MASEHDRAVLNCIFNPLLPIGENAYDEDLPADLTDDEPQTLESKQAKQLELEGVKAAESGDVAMAVGIFTRAINTCPTLPSCYNNRAQAYRIQDNIEGALADLDRAVSLSGGAGRTGRQALCQRGIVHRKEGREEAARRDFQAASRLGSQFAKAQLAQLNPYAALCNKMLHDAFLKLQSGEA
ncbi:tetratricopeptide repeat protein 36 isoform X1 [Bacillus rossius redtenbacheri]|uniref:tetratricopeptide repeat protein 36 isoform X1 n=1 Tax=Bacillus rossius redtenbacheri TaxID=93214 RepID=UPI002FDCB79E